MPGKGRTSEMDGECSKVYAAYGVERQSADANNTILTIRSPLLRQKASSLNTCIEGNDLDEQCSDYFPVHVCVAGSICLFAGKGWLAVTNACADEHEIIVRRNMCVAITNGK